MLLDVGGACFVVVFPKVLIQLFVIFFIELRLFFSCNLELTYEMSSQTRGTFSPFHSFNLRRVSRVPFVALCSYIATLAWTCAIYSAVMITIRKGRRAAALAAAGR